MDQKSPEAFRTISEVADWLGVPTHVLRFWESRFSQVKPVKRAGGRRYYRPADMELLGGIRKLLHEDGMTIRGVQKLLREQGVRHVAALSPPLDSGQGDKDSAAGNVVDLTDRRGARTGATPVEDAETLDETPEEAPEERRFPFDDEPAAAPASEPGFEPEEQMAEVARGTETEMAEPASMADGVLPVDGAAKAEPFDLTDPLPGPEAMDFMAHDAAPESFEPDGEDTADTPPAAAEPAPAPVTDPEDPMSSPEALSFAAHDAEPELAETALQSEADAAFAPEPAPEPEPEPARPALVMPDIDPDPDDDDLEAGPLPAADLRALRAARAEINIATLQALADRLEEITRRIGHGAGRPGSL